MDGEIVSIGEVTIAPEDKIWYAMPGRLGEGWYMIGPYEPDATPPDDEILSQFRKAGRNNMIFYKVAAPDKDTASGNASEQFRNDCRRRREYAQEKGQLKSVEP